MKKPLILWGGADVDPNYYHQPRCIYTQTPDRGRDKFEFAQVAKAVNDGTPVVGVCRGGQLLCVYNGGSLLQHTVPHKQQHSIETKDGQLFDKVSAGHHQIMLPKGIYDVLAVNPSPVDCWVTDDEKVSRSNTAEVVWFPETKCLSIQPHPEWAAPNDPFVSWINRVMKELGIDYAF